MKNLIYSTVLAALSAMPALALNSELSLRMGDNQKFTLAFDNTFYAAPSNTYNVTNVLPGTHHIRMTSAPAPMMGACGMPQLLFDGFVNIPQNARVTAYAMNFSQLNIVSIIPIMQQQQGCYTPNQYGNNGYNNGYPNGNGYNNGYPNGNGYNNGYPNGNGNNGYGNNGNNGNNYGNGYGDASGYTNNNYGWNNYTMSPADFAALKNSVNAQSFDSSKLTIAKQGVGSNHMSAAQVKELVDLMTFESSKLELAKFAYGHTNDRNNYYQVSDAFTFSSSVDELSSYINSYHG